MSRSTHRHAMLVAVAALCAASSIALPTVAAQDTSPGAPTRNAEQPSVALPPALDRVLRDYESAWRAGDATALSALFTNDGFVLQPGRPPVRGRDALRRAYEGQGGAMLHLRALHWAAEGRVGYILGAYRYGDATTDMGKFTLTLRREESGTWRIVSDMDNGNRPE